MGRRVILLGDSIIDNGAYVKTGEPNVASQLSTLLPDHKVVQRAVDGATTIDVLKNQLGGLESDDFAILSSGGNDALENIGLLDKEQDAKSRQVLVELWSIRERFRSAYSDLLDQVAARCQRAVVMTVYDPNFHATGMELEDQRAAEAALSVFNDIIQKEARRHALDVIELRGIFTRAEDFANPIEPSAQGGGKLAIALASWVKQAPN